MNVGTKKLGMHLGGECRIVRSFRFRGRQFYALKTAIRLVGLSEDKTVLIDRAEAEYMKLTAIAD